VKYQPRILVLHCQRCKRPWSSS